MHVLPTKLVSDYSEAERAGFRKSFEPVATDYRAFNYGSIILAVVLLAGVVLLPSNKWIFWFLGFIGIYLLGYQFFKPLCPACSRNVDAGADRYCPECGSDRISPGGFWTSAKCIACGKILRLGRGRRFYKARYCTHCGVFLDEQGI